MSEPLDLEPIKARDANDYYTFSRREGRALLAEVERLRGELARQAEQITAVRALFAGGPDTPCRTTWRDRTFMLANTYWVGIECVEVPLKDLRDALDGLS